MAFDANAVKPTDWGVMGCAAAVLLFSFAGSYATVHYEVADELASLGAVEATGISAWNGYAALGILLLLAVGALAAARVSGNVRLPDLPVGWNLVAAGAAGLGALLVVLHAFTYSGGEFPGVSADSGPGWSGWLVMLFAIGETVFAVLGFRESGEQVPWRTRVR